MLKLVLFVVPLGLDTFAVSTALGLQGLSRRDRLKLSLLLSSFEMAMPVVGLLIGRELAAGAAGGIAEYVAAAALIGLGVWLLKSDEEAEGAKVAAWSSRRGLALVGIGVSVSIDELAMGFTMGLLDLSLPLAVVLIGLQAFLVAQLGLRLGKRLGEAASDRAEKLAGVALFGLGVLVLLERLL